MKMTKAEREALKARVNDLVKAGVEKMVAEAMAEAELVTGSIKPVVY